MAAAESQPAVCGLPIVFQPELRRALEHLGQGTFLGTAALLDDDEARSVVRELTRAVKQLSATRTGALLVIERNMGLNDVSATGIHIDGLISADFLLNVFIVNTPLRWCGCNPWQPSDCGGLSAAIDGEPDAIDGAWNQTSCGHRSFGAV